MSKQIKTITLRQIHCLRWAKTMTEDWKGNWDPESHDEFDEWIEEINQAIKAVVRDRKRLRALLASE